MMIRSLLRKIRRHVNCLRGRDLWGHKECSVASRRFGTDYGGWEIATAGIEKGTLIYSFGIGEDISFDTAIIDEFGLTVHAFDPTPRTITWMEQQKHTLPETLVFHEYGLADIDGDLLFTPPKNPKHISHSILACETDKPATLSLPVKRLATIMQDLGHTELDILKMDIEGAEYRVIDDILRAGIYPTQVLVEFHHRFPGVGSHMTKAAVATLRSHGYKVFWCSDSGEEYGFVRRSANEPRAKAVA